MVAIFAIFGTKNNDLSEVAESPSDKPPKLTQIWSFFNGKYLYSQYKAYKQPQIRIHDNLKID